MVDQIIPYPFPGYPLLQTGHFNVAINLDVDKESGALASLARADAKIGFGIGQDGNLFAYNDGAVPWLEMSLLDDQKKANKKTYHELLCQM
ncbi:MAG: hypothetical protein IPN19_05455 [Elusimicrobia bacterium]|nr:hypothetical protein [Elusimicrobiota bacterium]